MLPIQEYDQVALEAEFEGHTPTLLNADEMRAKLNELGIAATSKLGRHALSGGALFSRAGHYRLAPHAKSVASAASQASGAAAVAFAGGRASEPVRADAKPLTFADVYCELFCSGTSQPHAASNGASPGQASAKSMLDAAADAWCGPEVA